MRLGPFQFHVLWLAMLAPFVYLLAGGAYKTARQLQLARTGHSANALVLPQAYEGLRDTQGYYYRFSAQGQLYTGHTLSQSDYTPGDSIRVLYLKCDPAINHDVRFLQENYSISAPVRQ